jgi:hypothetical protein
VESVGHETRLEYKQGISYSAVAGWGNLPPRRDSDQHLGRSEGDRETGCWAGQEEGAWRGVELPQIVDPVPSEHKEIKIKVYFILI